MEAVESALLTAINDGGYSSTDPSALTELIEALVNDGNGGTLSLNGILERIEATSELEKPIAYLNVANGETEVLTKSLA